MIPRTVQPQHIALVGLSGSGKSTVGPLLAALLGLPFVDTDREIERAAGMPIHRIFAARGETGFRALEAAEVQRALYASPSVISLGGGAVLDPKSRCRVWERACVIWLQADPGTLARRLHESPNTEPRPLLDAPDPTARLAELLAARQPHYATAHLVADTTERSPNDVAAALLNAVQQYWATRR
jgi:shikimate kinase